MVAVFEYKAKKLKLKTFEGKIGSMVVREAMKNLGTPVPKEDREYYLFQMLNELLATDPRKK